MANTRISITKEWNLDENWHLLAFQGFIAELVEKVPAAERDLAMLTIESEYDSSSVELEVYVVRPMTAEEEAADQAVRKRILEEDERRERNTLAALKRKYESQ